MTKKRKKARKKSWEIKQIDKHKYRYYNLICIFCGGKFQKRRWNTKCCSKKCRYLYLRKLFKNRKFSKKWRQKISDNLKGPKNGMFGKHTTWTKKMKKKQSNNQLGEKNSNWQNGGSKDLITQIRRNIKYKFWKESILKRDYPQLNQKDIKKLHIQVHHHEPINETIKKFNIKTIKDATNCQELWDPKKGVAILKGEHFLITHLERKKYCSSGFLKYLFWLIKYVFPQYYFVYRKTQKGRIYKEYINKKPIKIPYILIPTIDDKINDFIRF